MPLLMVMEVFLLDPSSRFVIVSFPGPLPQHLKDGTVYILKDFFAHHMLMIPCPSSICVMRVFSEESANPRSFMNCSTRGLISCSSSSFELPVITKSSANRIRLTFALWHWRYPGKSDRTSCSNPSRVRFASTGELGPPCGVPSSVR